MPINIQDTIQLTGTAVVGDTVPEGVIRTFKAAGAHNDTGGPVTLLLYLVPEEGIPDNTNRIMMRSIPNNTTDLCPELIGRGLKKGGKLYADGAGLNFGYTSIDTIIG